MQTTSKSLRIFSFLALVLLVACGEKGEDGTNNDGVAAGNGGTAGDNPMAAGGTGGTAGTGTPAGEGGAAGMMMPAGEGGMNAAAGEGGASGMVINMMGGAGGMGGNDTSPFPDIRGTGPECEALDSGYPGDEACIPPPAEGEGFQIHVGPSDYANASAFEVEAGADNSICFNFHTPNTEEVYYATALLSARPGTHHIINTMFVSTQQLEDGKFETCVNPGTGTSSNIVGALQGASKPYMQRYPVAPENEGIGRFIPANAPTQADLHYFNSTGGTLIREFWLNIYLKPASEVTERAKGIRGMGGVVWWQASQGIKPGTNKVYQYQCPIQGNGRILSLLGHYHSHGERFTAYIKRKSGEQKKVFEMYDYNTPADFNYDTISSNPMFSDTAAGAINGILEVQDGDVLQWECHIINDSENTLTYINDVDEGEMCNIWGMTVGSSIDCVHLSDPEQPFEITDP